MAYVPPRLPDHVLRWYKNPRAKPWQRKIAEETLRDYRAHLQGVLDSAPYCYMKGAQGWAIVLAVVVVLGLVLFFAIRDVLGRLPAGC